MMARTKKPQALTDIEVIKRELLSVPMSEGTRDKMSLNPYDQYFICRLIKMRDDAKDEQFKEFTAKFYKDITEFIANQYLGLSNQLTAIQTEIGNLKEREQADRNDINAIKQWIDSRAIVEKRLTAIEKHTKPLWIIVRGFTIGGILAAITMYGHSKGWW